MRIWAAPKSSTATSSRSASKLGIIGFAGWIIIWLALLSDAALPRIILVEIAVYALLTRVIWATVSLGAALVLAAAFAARCVPDLLPARRRHNGTATRDVGNVPRIEMKTSRLTLPQLRRSRSLSRRQALPQTDATGIEYWEWRARRLGSFAVLNAAHRRKDEAAVTEAQCRTLLPLLAAELNGDERVAVDVGCGPGRFTLQLAEIVGEAIGVDPIARLLAMAPRGDRVRYVQMPAGQIPLSDSSVDVAWICLVLGGISDGDVLAATAAEIDRVLRPGGLVFLVENTSPRTDDNHWAFRDVERYASLLSFAALELRHQYSDLGETISVMCGRAR